jgi:ribosomal protein S12 methylthiotransferase accessory factor YcaO
MLLDPMFVTLALKFFSVPTVTCLNQRLLGLQSNPAVAAIADFGAATDRTMIEVAQTRTTELRVRRGVRIAPTVF